MKTALPLGLALLIGAGLACFRAPAPPVLPERRSPVERETAPERHDLAPSAPPGAAAAAISEPRKEPAKSAVPSSWRKLASPLERELGLSPIQKATIDQILQDREREIRECHDAIRKAGFLDIRQYEWQVGLMKAGWYRKIDGILDGAQHDRFVALVEKGLFNEGLAFTVDPEMTVLE